MSLGDNKGFTLMEIMVALVILAAAMFVLLQGHYTSLNTLGLASDEVLMRNLTEEAMGYAELGVFSGKLSDTKEYNKRYEDHSWTYEATLVGDDENNPLYDVLVRINVPDKEPYEVHFFVYVGEPFEPDQQTGGQQQGGTR